MRVQLAFLKKMPCTPLGVPNKGSALQSQGTCNAFPVSKLTFLRTTKGIIWHLLMQEYPRRDKRKSIRSTKGYPKAFACDTQSGIRHKAVHYHRIINGGLNQVLSGTEGDSEAFP